MADLLGGFIHTFEGVVGGAGQAIQVVIGGAARTVENAVGTAVEAGKVVSTVPFTFAIDHVGHESVILKTATGVFRQADKPSKKELIDEVLLQAPGLFDLEKILEAAKNTIHRISGQFKKRPVIQLAKDVATVALDLVESAVNLVEYDLLLKVTKSITRRIWKAFSTTVGKLPYIKDGISSNEVNAATLGLLWSEGATLAKFMIDLIEPVKGYAQENTPDDTTKQDDLRGKYNELDFSKTSNRHAAICQLQRLAKSIVFILSKITTAVDTNLTNIDITNETRLAGDAELGKTITVTPLSETQGGPKEKWLFVNGIAGELSWLRLACEKLAKRYSREVTGIFNRGDGILWDLVECAGERSVQGTGSAASQKRLLQRTMSSLNAQKALKHELKRALNDDGTAHVVMIAHSQGCLLLRLVLEELVNGDNENNEDKERSKILRNAMRTRLCIFTFGNPSLDWKLERTAQDPSEELEGQSSAQSPDHLNSYVLRTEHFANKDDFVAKLGVLSVRDEEQSKNSGYLDSSIFINSKDEWQGHFFGAQYSLNDTDYGGDKGKTSWLLTCKTGQPIV
jgi:hypothetical protein